MAAVLGLCAPTYGQLGLWATPPATRPPDAVVRIAAPERDGTSYGSGTLVAVNEIFGLVVTNWHVVCEADGPVTVFFPNGFRSAATVLKTDRDWDLAALVIWRPNVQPLPISNTTPRPGDALTIAGYGSGSFLAQAGRCTQYVSPGRNYPSEMVEVDATARKGDSGGPILNSRGELAGVLFGSGFGRTSGSYCGRVRYFLNALEGDFQELSSRTMLAQQRRRDASPLAAIPATSPTPAETSAQNGFADNTAPRTPRLSPVPAANNIAASAARTSPEASEQISRASAPVTAVPPLPASEPTADDTVKTVLAAIGAIALLYHALRLLGAAVG